MNGRFWTMEDLDGIAALEKECFAQEGWNRRMLADSFLSGTFFGILLEEDHVMVWPQAGFFVCYVGDY